MSAQNASPTIESYRISPAAFSIPDDRYLGNPAVVTALVGAFCAQVEGMAEGVAGKQIDPAHVKEEIAVQIRKLARIFSGQDPDYTIIKGYHDVSLAGKLVADLGPFWRVHRSQWEDDAVAVLFDWLASLVIEKTRKAQGDDLLLDVSLKPSVQYATTVLLGIEKRAS